MKQIKQWICRKWGHTFHSLDMLMFKVEVHGGIVDAQIRCYRCSEMFTLLDLRKMTSKACLAPTKEEFNGNRPQTICKYL